MLPTTRIHFWLPCVVLASSVLVGCSSSDDPGSTLERDGRALFDQSGGATSASDATPAWSIVLAACYGEDRNETARQILWRVQSSAGLPAAFVESRRNSTIVGFGRFADPLSGAAQAELARVRSIELDGGRPFMSAFLIPPETGGDNDAQGQYDLRNVKARHHPDDALYTLQVGVYSREDRTPTTTEIQEFRQAAEAAVLTLRRDGEEAFYYHGPTRSMVTVGTFGVQDWDPQNSPGYQSSELRMARERHPHNLLNGEGIRERIRGMPKGDPRSYRIAPSRLVAIP